MRSRRTLRYGQRVMPCSRHRCFRTVTHSPSWIEREWGEASQSMVPRAAGRHVWRTEGRAVEISSHLASNVVDGKVEVRAELLERQALRLAASSFLRGSGECWSVPILFRSIEFEGAMRGRGFRPPFGRRFSDRIKTTCSSHRTRSEEKRDYAPRRKRARAGRSTVKTPGGRGEVRINTGVELHIGAVPADIASRGGGTPRTLGIFSH